MPRIYASSILTKSAQQAIDRITASNRFAEKQKQHAVRIIKKLFSSKTRKQAAEKITPGSGEGETAVGEDLALIEFSVLELKYENHGSLFRQETSAEEVEDATDEQP